MRFKKTFTNPKSVSPKSRLLDPWFSGSIQFLSAKFQFFESDPVVEQNITFGQTFGFNEILVKFSKFLLGVKWTVGLAKKTSPNSVIE